MKHFRCSELGDWNFELISSSVAEMASFPTNRLSSDEGPSQPSQSPPVPGEIWDRATRNWHIPCAQVCNELNFKLHCFKHNLLLHCFHSYFFTSQQPLPYDPESSDEDTLQDNDQTLHRTDSGLGNNCFTNYFNSLTSTQHSIVLFFSR